MPPAPRDVALTARSYILMVLVGVTAGFGNVHARFIGPLPPELRSKCAANFEGDLHGQQAAAIEAACSANVADRVYIAAEYLVVTLSLLSLAVCAYAFAGAERRAQRSDAVPRKQALALFLGTDLAALPWVILSPACFMVTYWSLVPLEVRRPHGPAPARPRSACHGCLVHATTPPVPLDRCVKAPTRARAQVIWQRWYCTIVLVLWAYAPAAYILTILLGYYRAFPAGVVVCTGMVIFDGINLPPRVWGPFSFVPYLSINRWAVENLYLGVVENYAHRYDLAPALAEYEFALGRQATAYAAMAGLGLWWRVVAFGCLLRQRHTRK